jgi:hypothetical protein
MNLLNKARVITTLSCTRSCRYCSNFNPNITKSIVTLKDLRDLSSFDEINISGGEPILFPDKLFNLVSRLKLINSRARYYLYISTFRDKQDIETALYLFDGIQYTIHDILLKDDIEKFEAFQSLAVKYSTKSYRLALSPVLNTPLSVIPSIWSVIKIKRWFNYQQITSPPDNEILYMLDTTLWEEL